MSVSRTWISPVPTFWTIALEIVAAGLPLFRGAQLAVDTTIVSVLKRDGSARTRCASVDGASLESARRRKEATHPELTGRNGRTKLVVLGCEVGGRWSERGSGVPPQFGQSQGKKRASTLAHHSSPGLAPQMGCHGAVPPKLWLFPCFSAKEAWVPMGPLRQPLR